MLFWCLILEFVSVSVYKAKAVWLKKLSELLLMCLMFHIRIVHFFGMLKKEKKHLHEMSMFTFRNFSPQAYLIWAPKLDVPKIGVILSKWTQNTPWKQTQGNDA